MWIAQKRRMRDRVFIPYEPEKHFVRAYAVSASCESSWDLFSPVKGYHPYNSKSKNSYTVSLKRQHDDWSKLVIQRDDKKCTNCGEVGHLEAHHIWPQGGYPQLRYILQNGITLCRPCHDIAFHATEITPNQFLELTKDVKEINSNIEAVNFWEYYTAGLEKGRVYAYGLATPDEIRLTTSEKDWFVMWASLNDFLGRTALVAKNAPIKDNHYKIDDEVIKDILNYRMPTI